MSHYLRGLEQVSSIQRFGIGSMGLRDQEHGSDQRDQYYRAIAFISGKSPGIEWADGEPLGLRLEPPAHLRVGDEGLLLTPVAVKRSREADMPA